MVLVKQIPATIVLASPLTVGNPFDSANRYNLGTNAHIRRALARVHPICVKQQPSRRKHGTAVYNLVEWLTFPRRVGDNIISPVQVCNGQE
jgi:hypothetical protein